jgi:hypothetical protein
MSRAVNNLDPVVLSAAGYDLVIIDTPHYVRVKHIDRGRIFSVVHDMIPPNDLFYDQGGRLIFLNKVRATLALRGNLIFVSEYTESLFHSLFPEHRAGRELVIHPSIPKDWVERLGPPRRREDRLTWPLSAAIDPLSAANISEREQPVWRTVRKRRRTFSSRLRRACRYGTARCPIS